MMKSFIQILLYAIFFEIGVAQYEWACSEPNDAGQRYIPSVRDHTMLVAGTDGNVLNIYPVENLKEACSGELTAIEYCYQYNVNGKGDPVFNWTVLVFDMDFRISEVYVIESHPNSSITADCSTTITGSGTQPRRICCDVEPVSGGFTLPVNFAYGVTESAQGNTHSATLLAFHDALTQYTVNRFTLNSNLVNLSVGSTVPSAQVDQRGLRRLWFIVEGGGLPSTTTEGVLDITTKQETNPTEMPPLPNTTSEMSPPSNMTTETSKPPKTTTGTSELLPNTTSGGAPPLNTTTQSSPLLNTTSETWPPSNTPTNKTLTAPPLNTTVQTFPVPNVLTHNIVGGIVGSLILIIVLVISVVAIVRFMLKRGQNSVKVESKNSFEKTYLRDACNGVATGRAAGDSGIIDDSVHVKINSDFISEPTATMSQCNSSGQRQLTPEVFEEDDTFWTPASDASELYKQITSKKYKEIKRHRIRITERLSTGQFSTVSNGIWQSPMGAIDVAVKQLQSGASEEEKVKFLQEAAINGQFRHPNVVQLMGVVTVGEPNMIILELLSKGDLLNYVSKLNKPFECNNTSSSKLQQLLLKFCQQVASGMEYLARKSFIHRDLAARNILVAQDKTCKISDFGMSRDLMDENYYISHGGKVPVKWTAPEALDYKKYSTASDVWSFGCVMYEIWSLGHKPFETYSVAETIRMVDQGYRLPPPPGLSKELYKIMIMCWHPDRTGRPTFPQLVEMLSRADFELFVWEEEDLISSDPQVKVIGAPLEVASNLYPELQRSFLKKSKDVANIKPRRQIISSLSSSQTKFTENELAAESVLSKDCLESVTSPSDSTAHLSPDLGYQSLEEKKAMFGFTDFVKVDNLPHLKMPSSALGNQHLREKEDDRATLNGNNGLVPPSNYSQLVFTDSSNEPPLLHRYVPTLLVQEDVDCELTTYDIPTKPETGYSFLARPSQPLTQSCSITFPLATRPQQNNHSTSHHKSMETVSPSLVERVHYTSNSYEQIQSYEAVQHIDYSPLPSHQQPTEHQLALPSSPLFHSTGADQTSTSKDGELHYEQIQSYEQVQRYQKITHSDLTLDDLQMLEVLPSQLHVHSNDLCSDVPLEQPSSYDKIQSYEKVKHSDLDETLFSPAENAASPALKLSKTLHYELSQEYETIHHDDFSQASFLFQQPFVLHDD